jgi:hypothetical protein
VPVPLVDHEAPFLTLRHWDTWHDQVTDRCYKNVQGTHAAIATLMRHDAKVQALASGPAQLRQFQRIVMNHLLLNYPPVHAIDNHLWTDLKHHFRQCMEVTNEKEEQHLPDVIYCKRRKMGESLLMFSMDFRTAIKGYNQISWNNISTPNDVDLLIFGLGLGHYPMLELNLRLNQAKESGANFRDVMNLIATFPNIHSSDPIRKADAHEPPCAVSSLRRHNQP